MVAQPKIPAKGGHADGYIGPPPIRFSEEYYMPRRDGPIWPLSCNVVRMTLARSDVATLHIPEIAMTDRCDYYGWARYSACVSLITFYRYPSARNFFMAVVGAFCEPITDFRGHSIDEGLFIEFTLYATEEAEKLRRDRMQTSWEEWSSEFKV